jgi:hypothetical protein
MCKVPTERRKHFKRLFSEEPRLQTGLVWKVCPQGIMDTPHEPCTDGVELEAHNVSAVAGNVSWRGLLVAPNVSSRPALFASPRADDVELLQVTL